MKPKWSVLEARPHADYTVDLLFADGTEGVYDALPLLERKPFKPLEDVDFFMTARAAHGTLAWNDDIDISPEHLYATCVRHG